MSDLGLALRVRFERIGAGADLDEAVAVGREAVAATPTDHAALARDGAACAVAAGHPDLAVELLEQGRGVFWSQLLDTRTDLTTLHQLAPQLAQQLDDCRAVLEQPTPLGDTTDLNSTRSIESRMDAARRFDELVDQVHALPPTALFPHPELFLKPPSIDALLPSADHGPIVIVNISQWRCDALILTHHGVTVTELPDLTEEQVTDEANRYLGALQEFEGSRYTAVARLALETAITNCLHWLWDRITAPILDTLGHTATPTGVWPRLWWCPTGALTLLPLHAAGYHHTTNTVYDRVVSSYTPTVRALKHARARPQSTHPPRILVIALPDTPGQTPLSGARTDHDLLAAKFTYAARTILTDTCATRTAILAQLVGHRWLHASCHGTQNLVNPTGGGLLPYDWDTAGLITVTDLTGPDHSGGEFAFLSACKTAAGGVTNLDEVITVAAAMQHAGWRHIIGTLWSVWDQSAAAVTQYLYPHLLCNDGLDPTNAAHALHHTIRKLRSTHSERPSTWAPFIHIGP